MFEHVQACPEHITDGRQRMQMANSLNSVKYEKQIQQRKKDTLSQQPLIIISSHAVNGKPLRRLKTKNDERGIPRGFLRKMAASTVPRVSPRQRKTRAERRSVKKRRRETPRRQSRKQPWAQKGVKSKKSQQGFHRQTHSVTKNTRSQKCCNIDKDKR